MNPNAPVKVQVRTTFRPDDPIEVYEHEAAVLRQQGLLHEPGADAGENDDKAGETAGKTARPKAGKNEGASS